MSEANFTLQAKGGVGKTFVTRLIAEYLKSLGVKITCIDTDPNNQSFAAYKSLDVERFELLIDDRLNARSLDNLVLKILESKDEIFVIDNGAASFNLVLDYLRDSGAIDTLISEGHTVRFHPILAAGDALASCLDGLEYMCEEFPNVKKVIWENEYHGKITSPDGIPFHETIFFNRFKDQFPALVKLKKFPHDLYHDDLKKMSEMGLTFAEAINSADFNIMVRSRFKRVWGEYSRFMEQAQLTAHLKLPDPKTISQDGEI